MRKTNKLTGKNIPFVQAHHVGGKQRPTAVVLRTSFTTGDAGAAYGIAQAWHNPYNKVDSCHYVVDEAKVFRCVPDKTQAKSVCKGIYKNAVTLNVCYDPPKGPKDEVVRLTAIQVARLCKLYKIKPRLLDSSQKLDWLYHAWKRNGGIILETDGEFPINKFLTLFWEEYLSY